MAIFMRGQLYSRKRPPPPPTRDPLNSGASWAPEPSGSSGEEKNLLPQFDSRTVHPLPQSLWWLRYRGALRWYKIVKALKYRPNGSVSDTYHCSICLERLKKMGKNWENSQCYGRDSNRTSLEEESQSLQLESTWSVNISANGTRFFKH